MSWANDVSGFLALNWGNVASVLGLAVSLMTLAVASKARTAAEGARAIARRQSLTEVLQDAVRKAEQVGIVWLRAQETASAASLGLARWPQELSTASKDNLLRGQQLANSIAGVALRTAGEAPTSHDIARVSRAQGRVAQLLTTELGESLRRSEGGRS